jgi:hypothetical protein
VQKVYAYGIILMLVGNGPPLNYSVGEHLMSRKSRELRLSQTSNLISAYEAAGLEDDRNCRFAKDMQWRLEQKKGLSPNRRKWLDAIIEEGVPAPKGDVELLARVEAAATIKGMKDFDVKILREFAGKIRRGWNLSPKQVTWMAKLLAAADDISENGIWAPCDNTVDILKTCVALSRGYSTVYWQTHGGSYKALNNVRAFIDSKGETPVDEWSVDKLIKAMARPLRELSNPKFQIGDMRWYHTPGKGYAPALVSAGPFINDLGIIVYTALVNGQLIETADITKQRRK